MRFHCFSNGTFIFLDALDGPAASSVLWSERSNLYLPYKACNLYHCGWCFVAGLVFAIPWYFPRAIFNEVCLIVLPKDRSSAITAELVCCTMPKMSPHYRVDFLFKCLETVRHF
jgi:hypothetical protein